ncbi:hypothetical protein GCM10020331_035920 [Ectobacillus funiculus]
MTIAKQEGKLILFIDEVHRFNKAQQDYLLPHVENGLITLIGATTENPFHDVNPAIRSRCGQIKELRRLSSKDVEELLRRALSDKEDGLGAVNITMTQEAIDLISSSTNGDARSALNILEDVVMVSKDEKTDQAVVDIQIVKECVENKGFFLMIKKMVIYTTHYCHVYKKSIRGSDVNAALHYLARLIEGGDLVSICRRILTCAYEDISVAAPDVPMHILAACQSVERLGLPEGRIPLANAVIELCLSPKTNSAYKALDLALEDVRKGMVGEIPMHLRDAHYNGAKSNGAWGGL